MEFRYSKGTFKHVARLVIKGKTNVKKMLQQVVPPVFTTHILHTRKVVHHANMENLLDVSA